MDDPETFVFADDGRFPNSPLPLLLYRHVLPADPAAMEDAFAANTWSNSWRNGIFRFHHFHSTAHEVLGIAAGQVQVAVGGPSGKIVALQAGDVVVIPAGVGHCNVGQTQDLVVVGAYPDGADYDTRRGLPSEHSAVIANVGAVRLPACDPVAGGGGPLNRLWSV